MQHTNDTTSTAIPKFFQNTILATSVIHCLVRDALLILLCLVLLNALIHLRSWQPLRSRLLTPSLFITFALIFLILNMVSNWLDYLTLIRSKLGAIKNIVFFLIIVLATAAYRFQAVRYFFAARKLMYIHHWHSKFRFASTIKMNNHIFHLLTSNEVYYAFLVTYGLFFGTLFVTLATGLLAFDWDEEWIGFVSYFLSVAAILINSFILVVCVLYDLFRHPSVSCRSFKQYFFYSDNYLFRIEVVFVVLAKLLILCDVILNLSKVSESSIIMVFHKYGVFMVWLCALLTIGGGVAVIGTIVIRFKYERNGVELFSTNASMLKVIRDPEGVVLFEDFCTEEYSMENFYCYLHLQAYFDCSDAVRRDEIVQEIIVTFVNDDAILQTNLPYFVKCKVKQAAVEKQSMDEVMLMVQDEIRLNLTDSFNRFVATPQYKEWSKKEQRLYSIGLSSV